MHAIFADFALSSFARWCGNIWGEVGNLAIYRKFSSLSSDGRVLKVGRRLPKLEPRIRWHVFLTTVFN
jgi:hypothetical protein